MSKTPEPLDLDDIMEAVEAAEDANFEYQNAEGGSIAEEKAHVDLRKAREAIGNAFESLRVENARLRALLSTMEARAPLPPPPASKDVEKLVEDYGVAVRDWHNPATGVPSSKVIAAKTALLAALAKPLPAIEVLALASQLIHFPGLHPAAVARAARIVDLCVALAPLPDEAKP